MRVSSLLLLPLADDPAPAVTDDTLLLLSRLAPCESRRFFLPLPLRLSPLRPGEPSSSTGES